MRRWLAPLAIGMVVLYVALAIGAAGCLFLHTEQPRSGHHHSQSHVAHSAFCAWACQANPAVSIHIAAPIVLIFALLGLLCIGGSTPPAALFATVFHSRAPPL